MIVESLLFSSFNTQIQFDQLLTSMTSSAFMGPTVLSLLVKPRRLGFKSLKLVHPEWVKGRQGWKNLSSVPPKALCNTPWNVYDGTGELSTYQKVAKHLREASVLFCILRALSFMFIS